MGADSQLNYNYSLVDLVVLRYNSSPCKNRIHIHIVGKRNSWTKIVAFLILRNQEMIY